MLLLQMCSHNGIFSLEENPGIKLLCSFTLKYIWNCEYGFFFFVSVEHISVYMDFEQPNKNIITRA